MTAELELLLRLAKAVHIEQRHIASFCNCSAEPCHGANASERRSRGYGR